MTARNSNLRRAAVLIRSLDADSAAAVLAQLSPAEANCVREAMRALGPLDADEQADMLAEFRRARPAATQSAPGGVELSLSEACDEFDTHSPRECRPGEYAGNRFDFLEKAPTSVLVSHLSREHPQTIAVVLSHLAPAHAAEVLAALPEKLQDDSIERLNALGDTDSESIAVLESELAQWAAQRASGRATRGRRVDAMSAILAAANLQTRNSLLKRLNPRERGPEVTHRSPATRQKKSSAPPAHLHIELPLSLQPVAQSGDFRSPLRLPQPPALSPQPLPRIDFDHLIHLDDDALAAVLREVDADALTLALAGSGDELVDRFCAQMPRRTAKTFRRELRRMGPTRLSDMEAAQRLVAHHAALQLARRRPVAQFG